LDNDFVNTHLGKRANKFVELKLSLFDSISSVVFLMKNIRTVVAETNRKMKEN
jgi:hypothetical protein